MIPTKIITVGDHHAARQMIATARNQLYILNRQRELGLKDEKRVVKPNKGVTITCISRKNFEEITIEVEEPAKKREKLVQVFRRLEEACICVPNFAMAVVVDETPSLTPPVRAEYGPDEDYQKAYDSWLRITWFSYGLDVCTGSSYTYVPDVLPNGWARYFIGQKVLVTVGYFEEVSNCDRKCLMDEPALPYIAISPIHIPGGMPLMVQEIFEDTITHEL